MLDIQSLADRLGLSVPQSRRMLTALDGVLGDHVRRGDNNAILVDEGAIGILDRAAQLKADGIPLSRLDTVLSTELNGHAPQAREADSQDSEKRREPGCEACRVMERYVAHLEGEVERLRDERDEFRQLALPDPDRRPWWARVLGLHRN